MHKFGRNGCVSHWMNRPGTLTRAWIRGGISTHHVAVVGDGTDGAAVARLAAESARVVEGHRLALVAPEASHVRFAHACAVVRVTVAGRAHRCAVARCNETPKIATFSFKGAQAKNLRQDVWAIKNTEKKHTNIGRRWSTELAEVAEFTQSPTQGRNRATSPAVRRTRKSNTNTRYDNTLLLPPPSHGATEMSPK